MSEEKISLTMTTTSTAGKTATKSITDINDNATDAELMNFASAFNNLTTNTLGTVSKVTKREIEDAGELTNPIQSVTSNNAIYTVSGSGTAYNATINLSGLNDALNADDTMGYGVYVGVQLPNNFDTKVYNNKVSVKYGALSANNTGGDNPGIVLYPIPGNKMCLYVGTIKPDLTGTTNEEWSATVQFDSVTVDGVKYSPWSVTFTLAE